MTRNLLLPFRGAPLLLVLTFTLGLVVAARAGLMGIPLAVVLLSWLFPGARPVRRAGLGVGFRLSAK